ncbi:four helix bundle protein [Gelidibacter salicanalis]|uniref:Four helix bundle protein n=1 Tax=Gelidibacter salicanalis TaxID=291193 RepID=A0A5C7AFK1_9FLAO|nr:four helix bundle protein [Gelidibacter salicanalis]TXE07520.1 four helix bundle protein [Gelidibacter salicanalis]
MAAINENLEQRTLKFATACKILTKQLNGSISNVEDCRQLVRTSNALAENYCEAFVQGEKKEVLLRLKIAHKMAKESDYWLRVLEPFNQDHAPEIEALIIASEEIKYNISEVINTLQ